MTILIAYWPIRGLCEYVYLALEYLEVPYERKTYTAENMNEWYKEDKYNLGLHFANLPYLVEGDFKLVQSLAILKYVGRKYGIFGGDSIEETAHQVRSTLHSWASKKT